MHTRTWSTTRAVAVLSLAAVLAACGGGNTSSGTTSANLGTGSFSLTSPDAKDDGSLPVDYTCDGAGATLPLAWSNAPSGTTEFALLMSTIPGPNSTKWNWVLYSIPGSASALAKNSSGIGTLGINSDGGANAYASPCSQGSGLKNYTFTLYALSGSPRFSVPGNQVSGQVLTEAIGSLTLGSASMTVSYDRTQTAINCASVKATTAAYSGSTSVTCDGTYAYITSDGIPGHTMMNGITATNLQVPTPQNFTGTNAWKIPLAPAIASATTSATDGPIGIAVNGVPIFNPYKQGGAAFGDTKALGELDICNGHAGRADDYHYHAAPTCLMADQPGDYWNTHPIGWALDGFAILGHGNPDGTTPSRDGCGGSTVTVPDVPAGYSYHVTDTAPYVMDCFKGTPSPDLAGQGGKYAPLRPPPVTPFTMSNMTLAYSVADYSVLRYTNNGNTYEIDYKRTTPLCWNFIFKTNGVQTGTETDCRSF